MNVIRTRLRSLTFRHHKYPQLLPITFKSSISHSAWHWKSASLHHDLESFLAYSKSTHNGTNSYQVGTIFEYQTLLALERFLGIKTKKCGGPDDRGVDLRGQWTLNKDQEPIRIIVQCKALNKKSGPDQVRELGGVVISEERETNVPTLGILTSMMGFTPLALRQASLVASSTSSSKAPGVPIALCTLENENSITGIYLNSAAEYLLNPLSISWVNVPREPSLVDNFKKPSKGRKAVAKKVILTQKPVLLEGTKIIDPSNLLLL